MTFEKLVRELLQLGAFDSSDLGIRRLIRGLESGYNGIWVDKFGPLCVVMIYADLSTQERQNLIQELGNYVPMDAHWILKIRNAEKTDFEFVFSDVSLIQKTFLASECFGFETQDRTLFQIRCDPKDDFGVYTDAAFARNLVQKICRDLVSAKVLNLFAYTCGFGLVAAKAGAHNVVNVDPNKDYLTWAKSNAAFNKVDFVVVPETAQKYLRRLVTRKQKGVDVAFDCIIIDPPAFGVGRGPDRLLRTLWPEILGAIIELNPKHVVMMFNDLYFRKSKNVRSIIEECMGAGWTSQWFESNGIELKTNTEIDQKLKNPKDPFFAPPLLAHFVRT